MLRKLVSIALLVSIVAVGVSGLLMIILGSYKFQLQMHPVHKIFGVVMCVSAAFHIYFNFSPIKSYLKINRLAVAAAVLFTLLVLLFVVGLNKPLNQEVIDEIEGRMVELEQKN